MKRLLLVSDPIDDGPSVQFSLLRSVAKSLEGDFQVSIHTPYCHRRRWAEFDRLGVELTASDDSQFLANRFLGWFHQRNESMLWAESWLREALFRKNSSLAGRLLRQQRFDFVVNLSQTVPIPSDFWWIQGTPLDLTLEGMSRTNSIAWLVDRFGHDSVAGLDSGMTERFRASSRHIVADSPYVRDLYRGRGVPVEGVLHTSTDDFSSFVPAERPTRDFVLLYLGKETDRINLRDLHSAGVKIVGFGSKIPWTTHLDRFTPWMDFRGRVSNEELVRLYSNALFTMFPFTFEALGWVPIESMACGTPVLTYGRQGPGTTVVNGKTGWLVQTADELVHKARQLWQSQSTGIDSAECVQHARRFYLADSIASLRRWIEKGFSDLSFGGSSIDLARMTSTTLAGDGLAMT